MSKHGCAKALKSALASDTDDCIIWPYSRNAKGYALVWHGGACRLASRVICRLAHGPAPKRRPITAHTCGHGSDGCINPRHVRWANILENEADKLHHGTRPFGERVGGAKLSDEGARDIYCRSKAGEYQNGLAVEYGVCPAVISNIKHRRTWRRATEKLGAEQ